jgi:hypothetical protein
VTPKRSVPARPLPAGWEEHAETTIHRRRVTRGTILDIEARNQRRGERWVFDKLTTTGDGRSWLDVYSTIDNRSRVITPDRVKTVHRRTT